MTLLDISNVHKRFGGIVALNNMSLDVEENSISALIGPNGCGKTTLFNVVSGVEAADEGKIVFDGQDITHLAPHKINRLGLSRTYQDTRLFPNLTVLENLMLPPKNQPGESIRNLIYNFKNVKKVEEELLEQALDILDVLEIRHMGYEYTKNLSGGQRKLVDLGRVLMSTPKMILLDEPTAGVNPVLTQKIFDKVVDLRKQFKLTILIIEHDMDVIMRDEVDKIYVANEGTVIVSGKPDQIKSDQQVINAYLGR